ncbi:HdeA/HdeB family chaperone [Sulfitobacter sp. HNIBRBA3233]|uniref:HdeA/HdeB family chaperone n=1 Tax=Sulfitobacter marinivivus TaxID=3158558 RepID=UPI0032DF6B53
MNTFFKTAAAATIAMSTAVPAFAAAHMDLNSMTCEMYNELSGADRDKVAMMAIAETTDMTPGTVADNNGVPTATDAAESVKEEESPAGENTTSADNNGEATATSTVAAGDDITRYAEEIRVLNRTCSRNWDAMVLEAAAGQSGTR